VVWLVVTGESLFSLLERFNKRFLCFLCGVERDRGVPFSFLSLFESNQIFRLGLLLSFSLMEKKVAKKKSRNFDKPNAIQASLMALGLTSVRQT